MKCIIGKKVDMTQVWQGDRHVAVTRVQAGPCTVTQVRTPDKDGYVALQLGYGIAKHTSKPRAGHLRGLASFRTLREFRTDAATAARGDVITVGTFAVGDTVAVTGVNKGKGFQGVVRRHGFKGQKATHGNKDQLRMPGSSGAGGVQHVLKGTLKPGHMGAARSTVRNLKIVAIDEAKNELLISGALPGARNSLVFVSGDGELTVATALSPASDATPAEAAPAPAENIETVVVEAKERIDGQQPAPEAAGNEPT